MDKMKPCPFCGSVRIEVYLNPNNDLMKYGIEQYKVSCVECAAQLYRGDKSEAIEAWNRRSDNATD